jgi:hypothetical protein
LSTLVNLAFCIWWAVIAFFAVQYAARRMLHEPRRARTVTLGVAAAFAAGELLLVAGGRGPLIFPSAVATTVLPLVPALRDVSASCTSRGTPAARGVGALDSLTDAYSRAVEKNGRVETRGIYNLNGWAADRTMSGPAVAACLVVDGRIAPARSMLGIVRPDVATAMAKKELAPSGFAVVFDAKTLRRGRHTLQVAARSNDGSFATVTNVWNITVR